MARLLKNKEASLGQVPGELLFIGEKKTETTAITLTEYNEEKYIQNIVKDVKELETCVSSDTVSWINIDGLHDIEIIREAGRIFNIHSLVLEDILNTGQRPKMEEYDNYLYFVLKMMQPDGNSDKIHSEQLSIILGEKFVLTFQERPGDVFDPVRDRIEKKKGRIRNSDVDYLTYALLDTVVDNYIVIVENMGGKIEMLEDTILSDLSRDILTRLNIYKREMNYLRRTIRPAKDFILQLSRLDTDIISENTSPYLKDLLDLATQSVEEIDSYREMLSDNLNIYNTGVSNRLNEIMKVLTIFSAIFIPLTFIAGIYGMNFDFIPELHFKFGYLVFWCVIITVALLMIRFFKHKKWM